MANVELTLPGSIMVNARGRRFVNEAVNYHDLNKVFRTIDSEHRRRTRTSRPGWWSTAPTSPGTPSAAPRSGTVPSWAVSAATPSRSSRSAAASTPPGWPRPSPSSTGTPREGHDPQFDRGDSAADRYLGDATQPHPCLAPLAQGPFYAIPIRPGTLGTCGGLVTDEDGRVLDRRGRPIAGLYAAGNVSATVFADAYPGGGATLGSAITRAYAVGRALARARLAPSTREGITWTLHAVIYRYADDAAALDEHRPRHRDYLRKLYEAGHRRQRPAGRGRRSRRAADLPRRRPRTQVAQWLDSDPFKVLGLIVEREIRAWNPAFGADRLA